MTTPTQSTAASQRGRPSPKIEVVREEHHAFPANRPGANAPQSNPNAMTADEASAASRAPQSSAREKLEASRKFQADLKNGGGGNIDAKTILKTLPPGHPMRAQLEATLAAAEAPKVARRPMFSTRKPTRLEVERERKGIDPDAHAAVRTQAESDPNYQTIGVPSQFKFYPFKTLTISPLKGIHQAKMSRAAKERKMRYVVEAISSTLGEGVSGFDLTPQDFYFLLYWHRLQSFPKNPQMIPYTCTNKEHVRRTILKEDHPEHLDPITLDISTIMNETTLKTEYLEELDLSRWADLIAKYDLHVETMRDIVEFDELQEEEAYYTQENDGGLGEAGTTATVDSEDVTESDESFDEVDWLKTRSVFLRRGPGRNTILERNEIVKQMSADEIFELDAYIELVTNYGVSEHTVLRCKECSASHRVNLSVDALTFLP